MLSCWGVILIAGLGGIPILHAALVGAMLLVLARGAHARRGAGQPGAGHAGAHRRVLRSRRRHRGQRPGGRRGHLIVESLAGWGAIGILLGVTLATVVLTELITNNAAAVLFSRSHWPRPRRSVWTRGRLRSRLTVAASASFLTPIGYQTNTMVYGLGGYRFTDYARLGAPLTLVIILTHTPLRSSYSGHSDDKRRSKT